MQGTIVAARVNSNCKGYYEEKSHINERFVLQPLFYSILFCFFHSLCLQSSQLTSQALSGNFNIVLRYSHLSNYSFIHSEYFVLL